MIKKILSILLFTISLFAENLKVAVAANVSYAIDELKNEFNKVYPNIKIDITIGSSGKLATQIKNGAPYDLFLSADMFYPNILYKKNIAISKPKVYAIGRVVIFSKDAADFSKGIYIVKNSDIKSVAIANPKTAPYGKAAFEALKNAKILNDVKRKLIYAESVSQTLAYVFNAADLGFVSKSAMYAPKMKKYKKNVNWIEVDKNLYSPIKQGAVILKNAKEKRYAKDFLNFIMSKKAKNIFKKYGYD
ncbi:molybdate ABC transporter substrate-binding protein [Nitrosophilus kaiyonis]|uniref:molybdate ABC transporter substrate-binding protein n=1 Tax=Nitrosophilus kaiyonis TaxID=2930200 RepID=UPI00249241AD|nr:molybdate ABC transporter substrate-binding protein [Nitrosophilus kaiyonis]